MKKLLFRLSRLSFLFLSSLTACDLFEPEFETSACQFDDEQRSVKISVNLEDSTFYSYENWNWRPINDHLGQDTHCTLEGSFLKLQSCYMMYCTEKVRICNENICETVEAHTLPYCEDASQIEFQIRKDWEQFFIIIPIDL